MVAAGMCFVPDVVYIFAIVISHCFTNVGVQLLEEVELLAGSKTIAVEKHGTSTL
jgi:hypothetical protein